MQNINLKYIVTFGALLLAFLHLFWPSLGIDIITVALLFLASLPWVGPILKSLADSGVKSLELPGGVKIELADVKSATDKVIRGQSSVTLDELKVAGKGTVRTESKESKEEDHFSYIQSIGSTDSNLGLVAFRIEIEKRLRILAQIFDINNKRPLTQIVREMQNRHIIPINVSSGLIELIGFGNRAAHGVQVSDDASGWVLDVGPSIIMELENLINRAKSHNNKMKADE